MYKIIKNPILALLISLAALTAQAYDFTKNDIANTDAIIPLIGSDLDENTISELETHTTSSHKVIAALAATALYSYDQKKYESTLFNTISIDYDTNDKDENYNMVPYESLQGTIRAIKEHPSDDLVVFLINFIDSRKDKTCSYLEKGKVLWAETFKKLYLNECFSNTEENMEELILKMKKT